MSDYVDSNLDGVPYTEQLAIFRKGVEAGRGGGGHNASDRFAVINGVDNTFASGGTDSRAVLTFGDGQARTIDHAYVAPTTYFLSNMLNGSSFCTAATAGTFVDLLAEGFDKIKDAMSLLLLIASVVALVGISVYRREKST